ncbi:mannose-P-dolichol utilization defect 1 [Mytilus galloprovincialis]|uniref:Mannose-P-dolichol utilization defect 1 n=1 Tax=Mytilus galloprovincialis TaxID=29158 RepID=A0A8B6H3G8_MYTGA|nr:mannose-P-dolichol utilization defect 1 [Mytilus galloprovincialis]
MTLSSGVEIFCNILSTSVIIGGLSLKIPQIISVVKASSTRGLSLSGVILEECAYSIMLTYHFASGYPLMTYLEYTVCVLQDLMLIMLILHYNDQFSLNSIIWFVVYPFDKEFIFLYNSGTGQSGFQARNNATLVMVRGNLVTPLSVFSKAAQIKTLWEKKDSGHVSLTTYSLAAYGCIARVVTTALQTADVAVLINYITSGSLNLVIVALIIVYSQNKKHKLY